MNSLLKSGDSVSVRTYSSSLIVLMIWAAGFGSFICAPLSAQVSPTNSPLYYKESIFTDSKGNALVYHMMIPEELRIDRKYPLVLVLHGRGGKAVAADILAQPEMRKKFPCFVIAPSSGKKAIWARPKIMKNAERILQIGLQERMPEVLELIEGLIKNSPIDRSRIYVTGTSLGGFGSFGAIASKPELFAAAVPLCGGWEPSGAANFSKVPLWIFHGESDPIVPVERSREMERALKAAGSPVKYTEFAKTGHNIFRKTYGREDLWEWLFDQRKASATDVDPMQKWMEFMTPGPEHQALMKRVGKWNIDIQTWMNPDSPPQTNVLKCEYKPVLGNRYLSQKIMPMDFNGMPFEAHGFIGFDTIKNIYVSSWIDTFGTGIATGTGTRTEKVITWTWIQTDPATGTSSATRAVEELISDDEFKFTIYITLPDGSEFINMTQHARRSPGNE